MGYNPIQSVDGATILCPSGYEYVLEDVSADGAGRTEDGYANKNRIGQANAIALRWDYLTIEEMANLLQALDPEYIMVSYLDAKHGTFLTKEFYVGNRTAPLLKTDL